MIGLWSKIAFLCPKLNFENNFGTKKNQTVLYKNFFCLFIKTNNCLVKQCLKISLSLPFSNCWTRKDLHTGHVIA